MSEGTDVDVSERADGDEGVDVAVGAVVDASAEASVGVVAEAGVGVAVDVPVGSAGDTGSAVVVGPLEVEPARPTGDAYVDGALSTLSRVGDLPTEAHGPVYEDVHRGLRDTLAALDR
ncbi:hypothetical protein [Streptomyces sp. SID3343]|uniref:hypothetical protein n=1 Tax=Streptomyces sp. SID3343 TaxID=2690260 RepID=UPI0013C24520|nr:hypothetical protein [Streptomyces sp. SID3343]MYW05451.1 hypothetical protein [Streptomyces sp. SID3343]